MKLLVILFSFSVAYLVLCDVVLAFFIGFFAQFLREQNCPVNGFCES